MEFKEDPSSSDLKSNGSSPSDLESLEVETSHVLIKQNRFIRFLHLVRSTSLSSNHIQHYVKKLKQRTRVVVILLLLVIFYGCFLTVDKDTFTSVYRYHDIIHHNDSSIDENIRQLDIDIDGNLTPEALQTWNELQEELLNEKPHSMSRANMGSYDSTELIAKQNFDFMAISEFVTNRTFLPFKIRSYQSNAEINIYDKKDDQCKSISFEHDLYYSPEVKYIDEDHYELMKRLIKQDPRLKGVFEKIATDKKVNLKEVAEKYLFRFGSSAQWIEDYQCHLVYSRLVVSPSKYRNLGHFSLIISQAYDKDWNEIKGKKIPYLDVTIPDNLDEQVTAIENKYTETNCSESLDEGARAKCLEQREYNKEMMEDEKYELLSQYYRIYPSLVNVPFKIFKDAGLSGPEDPKISLRKNKDGKTEPIVYFNRGHEFLGRIMHAVFPHRAHVTTIPLYMPGEKNKESQKNWSPFYYEEDGATEISRGTVNLVTKVSPLTIVKCSLDSGVCEKTFDMKEKNGKTGDYFSEIRGGTSYIKLPPVVPELRSRNIWIGLVKPHINNCGESMRFYRPSLTLLEETDGDFYYSIISDQLDFDRPVRSWKLKDNYGAGGYNVRSPNSIISWDVINQNNETKEYEDYMQISFSEADVDSYIFVVKGVMNYIVNAFRSPKLYEFMDWKKKGANIRSDLQNDCFLKNLVKYCDAYGAKHPEK